MKSKLEKWEEMRDYYEIHGFTVHDVIMAADEVIEELQNKSLIEKIRYQMSKNLLKDPRYDLDEKYLIVGKESFSRRELATEISSKTEVGDKMVLNMIMLAFDLVLRNKEKINETRTTTKEMG